MVASYSEIWAYWRSCKSFVKQKMIFEFYFNSKRIRVSLGIGKKTYLPGCVPSVFEFNPAKKRKERKSPRPRNNRVTSRESETESESFDSQRSGDTWNSVIQNTSKLLAENKSLRFKIEQLELENRKLKTKNIKLKSHIYLFDNVPEPGDEFRAATGKPNWVLIAHGNFKIQVKAVVILSFMTLQADCKKVPWYWKSKVWYKFQIVISKLVVHVCNLVAKWISSFTFSLAF